MSPSPRDHFAADHLKDDLRRRSVRGVAVMFSAHAGRIIIGIASAAVLARLLDPADFGLIAMVTAVTALFDRVRTFGLGAATVQRSEINQDQVSTLFWLNTFLGLAMTIACAALAPAIAWFYEEPELVPIAIWLAASFVVTGVAVQHTAILRRQMRYRALALTELLSEFVGATAGIIAALPPFELGYWSLVVLNLTALVTRSITTMAVSRWIPSWRAMFLHKSRKHEGVGHMITFGSQVSMSAVIQQFIQRLDRILIGKFMGADSLGYYTRSYFLLIIPVQRLHASLRSVVVPALSRIQDDPGRYRYFYRQATQLVAVLGVPSAVFAYASARPIVLTMLGPKWEDSIVLLQALSPAALIALLAPITMWIFFSLGRGRRLVNWVVFESIFIAIGFAIGLKWGALGVALSLSIVRFVLWPASIMYCIRETPVRAIDITAVLWRPFTASIVAGVATALCDYFWIADATTAPIALICNMAIFGILYLGVLAALPHGAATLREMLSLSRELRGEKV